MSEALKSALARARSHAKTIGGHLRDARDALANGDPELAAKHVNAAQRWHGYLESAHDDLGDALGNDPVSNPTAAMGAQVSNGQAPRDAEKWATRLFAPGRRR